ncbi:SAM-dependent methyltransferase [Microbispora siamensis]|uniref:SAM-dependent methyltransferase n=1 Tax=Microbispora siamensis TaxID=564413 RepID=UPI001EF27F59|nr:SAM-dependent methyltransferase [Microbispora siamensis]
MGSVTMIAKKSPAERERVMSEQAPGGFDVTRPNVARMYDYYLGGKNHFPADRAAAERIIELSHGYVREAVRENRAFLGRAVRHLAAECGPETMAQAGAVYGNANAPFKARPGAQIARFFDGFELVEPGLVPLNEWRPGGDRLPPRGGFLPVLGGVGRRP